MCSREAGPGTERNLQRRIVRAGITAVLILLTAPHGIGAESKSMTELDGVVEAQGMLDTGDHPQAIAVLENWLVGHPTDRQARFLYARSLAWDGRYAESLREYDQLLDQQPNDVDYLLGKGQTLLWMGRHEDALPVLARARKLAPDYEELWRLEFNALVATQAYDSGKRLTSFVEQARQRFPTAEWTDFSPPSRASLESGFAYDILTNGFSNWKEFYIGGDYRLGERKIVYGRARATERFDQADQELMAGFGLPVLEKWSLVFEGSVAPDAQVLPQWSVFGQVQRTLPHGFGAQIGWRHAQYELSELDMMTFAGEYWRGRYRASYTIYSASIDGGALIFSHRAQLDRYYRDHSRVSVIAATGEQVESIGNGYFIVNDVQTLTLTGLHELGDRWALSWELGQAWSDLYNKQRFRAGLTRRF